MEVDGAKESRLERNAKFHAWVKLEISKPFIDKSYINTNTSAKPIFIWLNCFEQK